MSRIYRRTRFACTAAAIAIGLVAPPSAAAGPSPSIVHVKTMHDGRPVEGTGVVVGVDQSRNVVFVMTASPLFRRDNGEPSVEGVQVSVSGVSAAVPPAQVLRPRGDMSGIALLRVDVRQPEGSRVTAEALRIDYRDQALGGAFVIAVAGAGGQRIDVPERIQFGATRLVVGDRSISHLPACLGAPALTSEGVFGIVVDCAPGRAPVVALATTARRFVERHLAGPAMLTGAQGSWPAVVASERMLGGPLLTVACDAVNTGDVELPFALARKERPVDATATLLNASSLRLGDVTVLALRDRVVKLRFTLVGVPPAHYDVQSTCVRGQALVTVRGNW